MADDLENKDMEEKEEKIDDEIEKEKEKIEKLLLRYQCGRVPDI